MVCEKNNFTSDFITPGGRFENNESDIQCLSREIKEELDVEVDLLSLSFVWEYIHAASGAPDKDVSIRLYVWKILWEPVPSSEMIAFHWITKEDTNHPRVSPIIKLKIIPDIVSRWILR